MVSKSEMKQMTREQLREVAKERNKKGIAIPAATYAQHLLWEERYPEKKRLVDDYEGWIDEEDERGQELLAEISEWRYLWW